MRGVNNLKRYKGDIKKKEYEILRCQKNAKGSGENSVAGRRKK